MKILVAEDDQTSSNFYKKILTKWGYTCDLVDNGRDAVNRAIENEGKYDICLMDIDMPYMSGYEATKLIRRRTKYFPILAVTGNISIKDKYSECGMDDYLKKPFNLNEVRKKIEELTIKFETIICNDREVIIKKETPMNKEELQELIELKKKGLTKLKLIGTETTFIVHKNIQNKISHDIIGEGKELSEFIDRSEKEPGRCHLYKVNLHVTKDIFTPQELEKAIQIENEIAEKFIQVVDQKIKDKN
ncbi:MAG: response regulator [Spirochaetota bacterium]